MVICDMILYGGRCDMGRILKKASRKILPVIGIIILGILIGLLVAYYTSRNYSSDGWFTLPHSSDGWFILPQRH
jgi:uncharacterized membrane protein